MKTFEDFISESNKNRVDIEEEGSWTIRVFFTANMKDSEKNWLQQGRNIKTAELTLDIDNKEKTAYVNRIDASITGQGFGKELLSHVIEQCKKHNIKSVSTYIENINSDSKNLFTKLGFVVGKESEFGKYYSLQLK